MQPPKSLKPIYVSDPNDPRLKAYNEKLKKYNYYKSFYEKGDDIKKKNWKYENINKNHNYKIGDEFYIRESGKTKPIKFLNKPVPVVYDKTKANDMKKYAALKGALDGGPGDDDPKKPKKTYTAYKDGVKPKKIPAYWSNANENSYDSNDYTPDIPEGYVETSTKGVYKPINGKGNWYMRHNVPNKQALADNYKKQGISIVYPSETLKPNTSSPNNEEPKKRKIISGSSSSANYNPDEYRQVESEALRQAREGQARGEDIVVLRRHQHKEIEQAKKQGKTVFVANEELIPKQPSEPVLEKREMVDIPDMEIRRPSLIEQKLQKMEVPEGPTYSQPNYTKKGIVVSVEKGKRRSVKGPLVQKLNKNQTSTAYYSLPKVELYKGDRKKLIPSIVQKATGYDKKKMEGYETKEGTRVPGEIERAQAEDRQIQFKGASSIKDLIAQRKYNKEYPEWDKKTRLARNFNKMFANE